MTRVLLIHAGRIPHYRIAIYNYLSSYLRSYGFDLIVTSDIIESYHTDPIDVHYVRMPLGVFNIARLIQKERIEIIIDYMELKHPYLFPTYLIAKGFLHQKIVYWGQGCDLLDRDSVLKNTGYRLELACCDAIVLYAEHLKKYVLPRFYPKTFIANNTLQLTYPGLPAEAREQVLAEYGIRTKKNIICVGRMQKRKRLNHLVQAIECMRRPDVGLILVGPDPEGVLDALGGENIYKLGPVYGDKKFDLLSAADVYCLPGAVGLSIVDAFHCGLPFVTEEGDESAEIMYLKDGLNGFVVPRANIAVLAEKLQLLLDNDDLRLSFSRAAKREIEENGSLDKMCSGFRDALFHVSRQGRSRCLQLIDEA